MTSVVKGLFGEMGGEIEGGGRYGKFRRVSAKKQSRLKGGIFD